VAIPTITFPEFPLLTSFLSDLLHKVPFEIPTILHPPLVHFAIALPVIIVILELFNVFAKLTSTPEEPKGKTVSLLSFLMIVILFFVVLGAYATGVTDGTNAWDTLSSEAQSDVKVHKLLGAYVVLSAFVLLIFKFLSLIGTKSKFFFLLLTIAFTILTLQQGKEGGELVFEHGVNIEQVADIKSDLEDAKDELSDAEDAQSSSEDKLKILSEEKKALEDKVVKLTGEKSDLEKSINELKVNSSKTLEEAKANAKSMIKSLEEKAKKTLDKATDIVANDAKETLSQDKVNKEEVSTTTTESNAKEDIAPVAVVEDNATDKEVKEEKIKTEEVAVETNATKVE